MALKLINMAGEETTLADVLLKENIPDGTVGKFIVIHKGGEQRVCLFPSMREHARTVGYFWEPENMTFIAAGVWVKKYDDAMLEYNSFSCCDKYGYDRPKNPITAEKLLEELKNLLLSQ
ncbi:MAG: hypothetical protein HYT94_04595 [Parcubacteria group bacterium]|nr:hypothetical protein [Parcubacteria group bacterium]